MHPPSGQPMLSSDEPGHAFSSQPMPRQPASHLHSACEAVVWSHATGVTWHVPWEEQLRKHEGRAQSSPHLSDPCARVTSQRVV